MIINAENCNESILPIQIMTTANNSLRKKRIIYEIHNIIIMLSQNYNTIKSKRLYMWNGIIFHG